MKVLWLHNKKYHVNYVDAYFLYVCMQVYWLTLDLVVMWIWVKLCGVRSSTTTSFQSLWVNKKVRVVIAIFACVVFCFEGCLYLAVNDVFTHSFLLLLPTSFHLGSWASTTWLWTPSLSVQVSLPQCSMTSMKLCMNRFLTLNLGLQHSCGHHFYLQQVSHILVAASLQKHLGYFDQPQLHQCDQGMLPNRFSWRFIEELFH